MASKLYVVVGGQFGSEAKGAVAGRICADSARRGRGVVCVRVGGPNAGHTVMGSCPPSCMDPSNTVGHAHGHPWRLRQVPVAAVTSPGATLVIAAGSEIDPDVLAAELSELDSAGYGASRRLIVDRSATLLTPDHVHTEFALDIQGRLGSTAKGIGAARADRIWRQAQTWGDWVSQGDTRPEFGDVRVDNTQELLYDVLSDGSDTDVVIEGTQGYGLGLHTRQYPYTTSGDCRAVDFLGSAGLSPWMADNEGWGIDLKVVIAVRPHPIRVAGNSGPLPGETTWADLGLPEERTTVTNKIRRVGAWNPAEVREAIRANGGPRQGVVWLAMTMWDTVCPEVAGQNANYHGSPAVWSEDLYESLNPYLNDLQASSNEVGYVGTGPQTAVVNDRMYE